MRRVLTVALVLVVATSPVRAEAPTVLALGTEEPGDAPAKPVRGLLVREIARQSVLIAARHGLGLATRDATLGEPVDLAAPGALAIATRALSGERVSVTVSSGGKPAFTCEVPFLAKEPFGFPDYARLVADFEARSRDELVRKLEGAAFARRAVAPVVSSVALPAGVEARLERLSFAEQLVAARTLHEAIAGKGESAELLGALVRAYANLGLLTEHHWTAGHKAFKARALLYAERLVVRDGSSRGALRHRAYARALAGLQPLAAADVAAAGHEEGEPSWFRAAALWCAFDRPKLMALEGSGASIAKLLAFTMLEDGPGKKLAFATGVAVLENDPDCFRVFDGLTAISGVSGQHRTTVAGPATLAKSVETLASFPGAPATLAKVAAGDVRGAIDALAAGGRDDRGEPSWTVLASLLHETAFVQTFRRAAFMRDLWSVPAGEFVESALPLIGQHRYRAFIESFAFPAESREARKLLRTISMVDVEWTEQPLFTATTGLGPANEPRGDAAMHLANDFLDWVERDARVYVAHVPIERRGRKLAWYESVCTDSPDLARYWMLADWERVKGRVDGWLERFGDDPKVVYARGLVAYRAGDVKTATQFLKRFIELSPEQEVFLTLAEILDKQGDFEGWKATLDSFLEQEDLGLEHAQVRVRIARRFMAKKEWAKAIPYAAAAAETWAQWAMQCAADCYEGAGDLVRAELWIRRVSERYEPAAAQWFFWCRRTGVGDVQAAKELAEERIEQLARNRASLDDQELVARFYLLADERASALAVLERIYRRFDGPLLGLHVALLAEKKESRDAAFEHVVRHASEDEDETPDAVELAKLLRKASEDGGKLEPEAVDKLREGAPEASRPRIDYFSGLWLEEHGHVPEARKLYERSLSVKVPGTTSLVQQLARVGLERTSKKK